MIKFVFLFKVESDEGLIRLRGGGRIFRDKKIIIEIYVE